MDVQPPLVSIIVPVYNAGQYLDACIQSIIRQTWLRWELLIVDDGSTDGSAAICDGYAEQDPRITVIHKNNEGVSRARNEGLNMARGDYVVFVDADDLLPSNSLELRMEQRDGVDLVIAGYRIINESNDIIEETANQEKKIWPQETAIKNVIVSGDIGYQGYSVNKLFRRDIILKFNLRFDDRVAYNEDRLFCVSYVLKCNCVAVISEVVYIYRQTSSGAMAQLKTMRDCDYDKIMSEFLAYDQMIQSIRTDYPNLLFPITEDAMNRAVNLKRVTAPTERRLMKGFGERIISYGVDALRIADKTISARRVARVLYHMLKRK